MMTERRVGAFIGISVVAALIIYVCWRRIQCGPPASELTIGLADVLEPAKIGYPESPAHVRTDSPPSGARQTYGQADIDRKSLSAFEELVITVRRGCGVATVEGLHLMISWGSNDLVHAITSEHGECRVSGPISRGKPLVELCVGGTGGPDAMRLTLVATEIANGTGPRRLVFAVPTRLIVVPRGHIPPETLSSGRLVRADGRVVANGNLEDDGQGGQAISFNIPNSGIQDSLPWRVELLSSPSAAVSMLCRAVVWTECGSVEADFACVGLGTVSVSAVDDQLLPLSVMATLVPMNVSSPGEIVGRVFHAGHESSLRFEHVPAGAYLLRVRTPGFGEHSEQVNVVGGQPQLVQAQLVRQVGAEDLQIVVSGAGAGIRPDGFLTLRETAGGSDTVYQCAVPSDQHVIGETAYESVATLPAVKPGDYFVTMTQLPGWEALTCEPRTIRVPESSSSKSTLVGVSRMQHSWWLEVTPSLQDLGISGYRVLFRRNGVSDNVGIEVAVDSSNQRMRLPVSDGEPPDWCVIAPGYAPSWGGPESFVNIPVDRNLANHTATARLVPGWGAMIRALDVYGNPVNDVRVYCDGQLAGATDPSGRLHLTLNSPPDEVRVFREGMVYAFGDLDLATRSLRAGGFEYVLRFLACR